MYREGTMGYTESNMIHRAKKLRQNPTPQERKLWYEFLRSYPIRFRRQHPVGPYILDFYCHAAKLAIELDGGGHYEPKQMDYDARRDAYLRDSGIQILCFSNLEIQNHFSAVCEMIDRIAAPSAGFAGSSPGGGAKY